MQPILYDGIKGSKWNNRTLSYGNFGAGHKLVLLIPPGQDGRHFADDVFKCIFVNENLCILIWISLKFVPKSLNDNIPTVVWVMAWCQTGDKPLPEPMLTELTEAYIAALGGDELKENDVMVVGNSHDIDGKMSIKAARLTHWDRDKMGAIFQTTCSNAFSWMKMLKFRLRFHWSLFPRVQLTILQPQWVNLIHWRKAYIFFTESFSFWDIIWMVIISVWIQ